MKKTLLVGGSLVAIIGLILALGPAKSYAANRVLGRGFGGPEHERIFRAVMDAKLDIVAEKLNLSAEQKDRVTAIKDDLIQSFKENRESCRDLHGKFAAEFQKDTLDRATLDGLANERKAKHAVMEDKVKQAIVDIHDLLTPEQRAELVDLVKEHFERGIAE
ncbi:MAG: Spy/CpxP family protein refolding chaperone [Acidobacteriota bacterium]